MREPNDHDLDLLLGQHFAAELDMHAGSAQQAFAQAAPVQRANRVMRWLIPAALGTMAASVLVAIAMLSRAHQSPIASPIDNWPTSEAAQPAPDLSPTLERAVAWQTFDEGPVVLGQDLPVRRVRQEVLQHIRWHDPQLKTTIEMTVPQERIIYVEMESY